MSLVNSFFILFIGLPDFVSDTGLVKVNTETTSNLTVAGFLFFYGPHILKIGLLVWTHKPLR